jgi:hypothetical protein
MSTPPSEAPPSTGRIDPAAVASVLLAVSWPLIGAVLVPPVAAAFLGGSDGAPSPGSPLRPFQIGVAATIVAACNVSPSRCRFTF